MKFDMNSLDGQIIVPGAAHEDKAASKILPGGQVLYENKNKRKKDLVISILKCRCHIYLYLGDAIGATIIS